MNPIIVSNLLACAAGFIFGYFICKKKVKVKKYDIRNVTYRDLQ